MEHHANFIIIRIKEKMMETKTINTSELVGVDQRIQTLARDMAKDTAYIMYSYSLTAIQIFKDIEEKLSAQFEGTTCRNSKIYANEIELGWNYALIESVNDSFAAVVFYAFVSKSVPNAILQLTSLIAIYFNQHLRLRDCAIEKVVHERNILSFVHSEVADAFKNSVILDSPYTTMLHGDKGLCPTWYVVGNTAVSWVDEQTESSIQYESKSSSQTQSNNSTSYNSDSNFSSGGCYIATTVYGSYDCPEVWTLRRFRDFSLAQTWYGRTFIKMYYLVSPSLVKYFGDTNWFKDFWKKRLDKLVNSLKARGFRDDPYRD